MAEIFYLERHKDLSHVSAAILDVVEEIEAAYEAGPSPRPENLYMYDYFGKVFAPGDLVVLSGNSEMRNSFLFAEIVNQADYDSCCVLSHDSKLFARDMLMKKTGLNNKKIFGREWFADEDWDCFNDAIAQLNSSKLLLGGIPARCQKCESRNTNIWTWRKQSVYAQKINRLAWSLVFIRAQRVRHLSF